MVQDNPDTFVRGILVASSLDARAEAALLVARDIQFVAFSIAFTFTEILSSKSTFEDWTAQRKTVSGGKKVSSPTTQKYGCLQISKKTEK